MMNPRVLGLLESYGKDAGLTTILVPCIRMIYRNFDYGLPGNFGERARSKGHHLFYWLCDRSSP